MPATTAACTGLGITLALVIKSAAIQMIVIFDAVGRLPNMLWIFSPNAYDK